MSDIIERQEIVARHIRGENEHDWATFTTPSFRMARHITTLCSKEVMPRKARTNWFRGSVSVVPEYLPPDSDRRGRVNRTAGLRGIEAPVRKLRRDWHARGARVGSMDSIRREQKLSAKQFSIRRPPGHKLAIPNSQRAHCPASSDQRDALFRRPFRTGSPLVLGAFREPKRKSLHGGSRPNLFCSQRGSPTD